MTDCTYDCSFQYSSSWKRHHTEGEGGMGRTTSTSRSAKSKSERDYPRASSDSEALLPRLQHHRLSNTHSTTNYPSETRTSDSKMLSRTAMRLPSTVAQRGFHTTRPRLASPYHYPEGPRNNIPFNPLTRFFAVRYWTFMAVGFGAPFAIAVWQTKKNQ